MDGTDLNHTTFGRSDVVAFYVDQQDLLPEEEHLFGRYVPPGLDILDLGIGAGRTTPALAAGARRYVGLDYVPAMIEAAGRLHPDEEFVVGDASDLSSFADGSFDAVVFSFNGLDCLPTVEGRVRCIAECRRVLRPGGVFIMSSHNPRAVLGRAVVAGSGPVAALKRLVALAWGTVRRAVVRMPQRAFWTGEGYLYERTHGGLRLYAALPSRLERDVSAHGFCLEERVPSTHPATRSPFGTAWYYYAFRAI